MTLGIDWERLAWANELGKKGRWPRKEMHEPIPRGPKLLQTQRVRNGRCRYATFSHLSVTS